MKKNLFKRGMAGLLSLVMCLTALVGIGTTTAYAAGERAEVYLVSFPRSGDANIDYSGTWGHPNLRYMNGWHSGESKYTTIRAMHSYDGNICYCIEPGVRQDTGDTYTSKDETFWDNLPSDINSTISPYDMKLFIGRIMQYGYTGPISTSWRSQNPADAATLAEAMATQVLIWETVVGERDEDFDYVSPGSYDAVKGVISTAHPLYDLFCDYYDSIEASVQRHSAIPSFMSKNPNRAQSVELEWDGSGYTATLTDHNRVLSDYSFSANEDGVSFSVSGNQLVITATDAPSDSVRITANKVGSSRRGVITWTDGTFNQGSGKQDVITYAQSVSDPVQAFLNLKVSYGSAKIVKTSEDGKVDNLTFTVTGNGVNQTVKTNARGEIQIDNLMPGVYTVTEMDYDKYEPQESRRVTVVSGQVSTVTFNNKLKRGDLQIVKSSEDNLNEGVTFHLYGTSLSGIAVDEYAATDANGVATFEDVLISGSTPYTVEEVDTAVRYVVPEAQSAPINWNEVTNRSFLNILKKFSVTVTKSDAETGTAQGDASLAGAVYGIYKGETLVDTYTTDKNGQFVTKEYICDNDWTVREITPSEGYLLDTTVHKVGAEPQLYTVEHNQTANDVTEQVTKGNIAIIKHTDNGETQIETPEGGAEFAVYLKAAGSYENAKSSEEVEKLDIPVTVITQADCIPDHYKNDINGKIIAINPAVLKPEYRRADRQLYLVTGGFGASANSRGSAVFCTNLYDGKPTRYERMDVMGEVKTECMPHWAVNKATVLKHIQGNKLIFEYGGKHFCPYRLFTKAEDTLDFISRHTARDNDLGLTGKPNAGDKSHYDHSAFYERSSIKNCDLFICVDNGKLYCPGEKEMFEWRGEVGKADFDGKTKAKPSRNKDYER